MERLKKGIFITPKDIQLLTGFVNSTAKREHKTIRDVLGKKRRRLTVSEYCDYYEIDFQEVVAYINPFR